MWGRNLPAFLWPLTYTQQLVLQYKLWCTAASRKCTVRYSSLHSLVNLHLCWVMSSRSVVYFWSSPVLFPSYAINTGSPCRSRRGSCPAWRQQVLAACSTSCTVKYTLVSRGSNAIRQQRLYTSYVYIQSTVNTNNWLTSGQPMSLSTPPFTDLRLGKVPIAELQIARGIGIASPTNIGWTLR